MQEITRVLLENEMDIILANRRSMRLAELAGLSLASQTSFATAVSEVSRNAVEQNSSAQLILMVELGKSPAEKFIVAVIREAGPTRSGTEAPSFQHARRLVGEVRLVQAAEAEESNLELRIRIPNAHRISPQQVSQWGTDFEGDRPASPYEEIKRKNHQLLALAEQLRASELKYRTLTETLPLLVFTFDGEKGLTYINPWTEQFTGHSLAELSAQRWQQVYHPDDYAQCTAAWDNARNEGKAISQQMRLRHAASGEYLWHLSLIIPQLDEGGKVQYWIGYAVDIHAQKLIEQALKDNKELTAIKQELEANQVALQRNVSELAESNRELEQFAYVASHDLQEPLRKIMFYGDYLSKQYLPALDEKGATFLNNMIHSARRMQQLIRDVLAYSTIGRTPQMDLPVDLNEVAREALQDLDMTIADKNAEVQVEPLPHIRGNAYQLRQLFENLISNSIKYSRADVPPRIRISAELTEQGAVLHFEDNGIGFEDQYLDRMFNLFQRLHTRNEYEGTGIGLAICKRIAEVHNGSITGCGRPGEGAVFSVNLPVAAAEPA